MTAPIFFAVLGSALLHALWNSLVKVGTSRLGAMVALTLWGVPIGLTITALRPLPTLAVLPWLAGSVVAHFFYMFFLSSAYERGDLSRVYPIARGTAPLIVALLLVCVRYPARMLCCLQEMDLPSTKELWRSWGSSG